MANHVVLTWLLCLTYVAMTAAANGLSACFYGYLNNQNGFPQLSDSNQYFTTTGGLPLNCSAELAMFPASYALPSTSKIANGTLLDGTTFVNGTVTNGMVVYNNLTYANLSNGSICAVPRSKLTGMSYSFCVKNCGPGQDSFDWTQFSMSFTSWLLPWLALLSQLPFGAQHREDNILAVVLAVGSPALAAYSLVLTVLNGKWVAKRFSNINYKKFRQAGRLMGSLQQAPLVLSEDSIYLASLVVLEENDKWWTESLDRLSVVHTWSIAAAVQIFWVGIAYLFTVAQSFQSLMNLPLPDSISDGQAVGTEWLWLLPVVIGWLQVSPKCDSFYLEKVFDRTHELSYVVSDSDGSPTRAKGHAFKMVDQFDFEEILESQGGHATCSAPIFNYARIFKWTQQTETVRSMFVAARHSEEGGELPNMSVKTWPLDYCSPPAQDRPRSHFGPQIWQRIILASISALFLQWGTAGSAIIIDFLTPTVGLGCRSGSVLLYASLSTIVMVLLILSSVLSHCAARRHPDFNLSVDNPGDHTIAPATHSIGNLSPSLPQTPSGVTVTSGVTIVVESPNDTLDTPINPTTNSSRLSQDLNPVPSIQSSSSASNHTSGTPSQCSRDGGDDIEMQSMSTNTNPPNLTRNPDRGYRLAGAALTSERTRRCIRWLADVCRVLGVILATINACHVLLLSMLAFANVLENCWCESVALTLGSRAYDQVILTADEIRSGWGGGIALGITSAVIFFLGTTLFYTAEINPRERRKDT